MHKVCANPHITWLLLCQGLFPSCGMHPELEAQCACGKGSIECNGDTPATTKHEPHSGTYTAESLNIERPDEQSTLEGFIY